MPDLRYVPTPHGVVRPSDEQAGYSTVQYSTVARKEAIKHLRTILVCTLEWSVSSVDEGVGVSQGPHGRTDDRSMMGGAGCATTSDEGHGCDGGG